MQQRAWKPLTGCYKRYNTICAQCNTRRKLYRTLWTFVFVWEINLKVCTLMTLTQIIRSDWRVNPVCAAKYRVMDVLSLSHRDRPPSNPKCPTTTMPCAVYCQFPGPSWVVCVCVLGLWTWSARCFKPCRAMEFWSLNWADNCPGPSAAEAAEPRRPSSSLIHSSSLIRPPGLSSDGPRQRRRRDGEGEYRSRAEREKMEKDIGPAALNRA